MLHGHGNDIYKHKHNIIADFSSNIAHGGTHSAVVEHLKQHLNLIGDYPEPNAESLCKAIASKESVNAEQVVVTNGSTEAFYLLAQIFKGGRSLIYTPSFAEYEDAAKCHEHLISFYPIDSFTGELPEMCDCVWLGNPNNPDGTVTNPELILDFCRSYPNICFILDEAYYSLCPDYVSPLEFDEIPENLIIVRSLTKLFALPGLRLGYIVAGTEIYKALNAVKIPWSVNALAIEAGNYIMSHYDELIPDTTFLVAESRRMQNMLKELDLVSGTPSYCNFFLAQLHIGLAKDLKEYLVQEHGFLIRDAANFRGLTTSHFRVAALSPKLNDQLVNALKTWIQKF